jgi:hypothetical protein
LSRNIVRHLFFQTTPNLIPLKRKGLIRSAAGRKATDLAVIHRCWWILAISLEEQKHFIPRTGTKSWKAQRKNKAVALCESLRLGPLCGLRLSIFSQLLAPRAIPHNADSEDVEILKLAPMALAPA